MPKVISLKPTVKELDKAKSELGKVAKRQTGDLRKELELKIEKLESIREELVVACGKTFPLWVEPSKVRATAAAKARAKR